MCARSRGRILLLILAAVPAAVPAQRVNREVELHAAPDAQVIATVHEGAPVELGARRGGEVELTIEGFVHASTVVARRGSAPLAVKAPSGALLRREADAGGAVLAELKDGMALRLVSRRGEWLRVSRTGWVTESAVSSRTTTKTATAVPVLAAAEATSRAPEAARPGGPAPSSPVPVPSTATPVARSSITGDSAFSVLHATALAAAPGGSAVATLNPTASIRALARDAGWVRVQVEGWVRERDLAPADSTQRSEMGAADLRANPTGTRGVVVRWDVQFIAMQTADALRRDFAKDEPYLLARGPGAENSLLYLAVPPSLLEAARRLQPLESIVISARVRTGRSDPAGVPILDLLSLANRR